MRVNELNIISIYSFYNLFKKYDFFNRYFIQNIRLNLDIINNVIFKNINYYPYHDLSTIIGYETSNIIKK